jgi:hypothetical protein
MLTPHDIDEISFHKGRQLGRLEGMKEGREAAVTEMLWLLAQLESNPDISDAKLHRSSKLPTDTIRVLRKIIQPHVSNKRENKS